MEITKGLSKCCNASIMGYEDEMKHICSKCRKDVPTCIVTTMDTETDKNNIFM